MLFDNNDIDLDFSLLSLAGLQNTKQDMSNMGSMSNMKSMSNMSSSKFLTAKEGFLRGNMFKDEYKPYKNLTYVNIKPRNDREAKLFNVMQYSFAINDMNLYLDLHPEDRNALMLLEEFIKEEKEAKKEYIKSYGPLTINETSGEKYEWINGPWSWENLGGNIYV